MANTLIVADDFPQLLKAALDEVAKESPSIEKLRETLVKMTLTAGEPPPVDDQQRHYFGRQIKRVDVAKSPYTLGPQLQR